MPRVGARGALCRGRGPVGAAPWAVRGGAPAAPCPRGAALATRPVATGAGAGRQQGAEPGAPPPSIHGRPVRAAGPGAGGAGAGLWGWGGAPGGAPRDKAGLGETPPGPGGGRGGEPEPSAASSRGEPRGSFRSPPRGMRLLLPLRRGGSRLRRAPGSASHSASSEESFLWLLPLLSSLAYIFFYYYLFFFCWLSSGRLINFGHCRRGWLPNFPRGIKHPCVSTFSFFSPPSQVDKTNVGPFGSSPTGSATSPNPLAVPCLVKGWMPCAKSEGKQSRSTVMSLKMIFLQILLILGVLGYVRE